MCRLLATVSPRPANVTDVLGGSRWAVFQDMARLHRDGWGTAWIDEHDLDRPAELKSLRCPGGGFWDPRLTAALTDRPTRARITHLRLATHGMGSVLANTHPFVADGIAFAHNGSIRPASDLNDLLNRRVARSLTGTTDSERYFGVVRTQLDAGLDFDDAVTAAAGQVRDRFPHASLNALVLTATQLAVVHANQGAHVPAHDFDDAARHGYLPAGHDDGYYRMHMLERPDGSMAFASSGFDVASWAELPPESVTFVDLATCARRTVALPRSGAEGVAA